MTQAKPPTICLVDYENVKDTGLSQLPPSCDRVILFVGKGQKPKINFIQGIIEKGARLDLVPVAERGKNNLDFYIAFYLGREVEEDPFAQFIVFSEDKDLDPLIKHVNKFGMRCSRESPQKKPPASPKRSAPSGKENTTLSPDLEKAVFYLRKEKNLPRKRKGLVNRLGTHFRIKEPDVDKLVGELKKNGFIKIDEKDGIEYNLQA